MKSKATIQKRLACLLVAVLLLFTLPLSASAATTNDAVQGATTGVVQVRALYFDSNNNIWTGYTGTAFLINEEYLLTCDHVFDLSADDLATGQEAYGWTEKQIREHSRVEIVVMRDVTIEASIVQESAIMDFAILKLSQKLYDRTYLPLRSSSEVQQTESIYSLGFPGGVSYWQDTNTFTSDDVTITAGYVNKLNTVGTVNYIQHGAKITGGNSGGPLVDENGNVVGINVFTTGTEFEADYSYAVAIDQPKQVLDSLGIDYTPAGTIVRPQQGNDNGSTEESSSSSESVPPEPGGDSTQTTSPVTTRKDDLNSAIAAATLLDTSMYEADANMTDFNSALSNAQRIADKEDATQEEVDNAAAELTEAQGKLVQKAENGNMMLIIIAVAAAVVIAAVVIIIIVVSSSKKKKKAPAPAPRPYPPVGPQNNNGFSPVNPTPANNVNRMGASSQETSVLNQGSNETTVLNQGSNETTLLNQSFGSLVRSKNGEKITINSDNFVIGRERARVNYCVSDNTSVGRTHARISNRGGAAYIADMQSTNGTYVNGVKLNPGQEVALKNGDRFTLADENFVYNA